jgi:hypothetical protein
VQAWQYSYIAVLPFMYERSCVLFASPCPIRSKFTKQHHACHTQHQPVVWFAHHPHLAPSGAPPADAGTLPASYSNLTGLKFLR